MTDNPFTDCATLVELRARYRQIAPTYHPDTGGDAKSFNVMRRQYDAARRRIERAPSCHHCRGTKRVEIRRGFAVVNEPCPECGYKKRTL